jgi:hypothetical protein
MSQKSNKKSESVIKANSTKKTGTKNESQRQPNILPLTNENVNVFNFRNNNSSSQGYKTPTSNSSVGNNSNDDAETVKTNYSTNPYGLHTPPRVNSPVNEMDVDDYEPCATELLTRKGKKMCYNIDGNLIPVTSATYKRDMTIYDIDRNIIPKEEHLPENILNDDMMEEESKGGKRHRKTLRKTKRKNARRHKRRHTRKYK